MKFRIVLKSGAEEREHVITLSSRLKNALGERHSVTDLSITVNAMGPDVPEATCYVTAEDGEAFEQNTFEGIAQEIADYTGIEAVTVHDQHDEHPTYRSEAALLAA